MEINGTRVKFTKVPDIQWGWKFSCLRNCQISLSNSSLVGYVPNGVVLVLVCHLGFSFSPNHWTPGAALGVQERCFWIIEVGNYHWTWGQDSFQEVGVAWQKDSKKKSQKMGNEILNIHTYIYIYMGVSKNRGTPKSSILIGFSIINHPFWGTPIFGNTHI